MPSLSRLATSQWLASPMMTWSRRYRSATACGSSRVLMIGRFSVVSSPTSTSKKSARWLSWNPGVRESCPIPTRPDPVMTWRTDEERHEVAHDVGERGLPAHQVVLVRAVGRALAVGVVLVEVHPRQPGSVLEAADRLEHDQLARAVPGHRGPRVGDLGRRVLRVRVVDVEPRAVGQHDVGQRRVLDVGQLARVGQGPADLEPPGVPQRRLVGVVPRRPARPHSVGTRIRVDDVSAEDHRVRRRVTRNGDAVLRLDAHDAADAHAASLCAAGRGEALPEASYAIGHR